MIPSISALNELGFGGVECLGVFAFTTLLLAHSPVTLYSPKLEIALYGAFGAVGGLVIAFIVVYLVCLIRALPFPTVQFFRTADVTTMRIEQSMKQSSGIYYRRDMKRNPHDFIFPFIQFVSVSPIQHKLNYLDIRCSLVSALHHDFELYGTSVKLIFNGASGTIAVSRRQPVIEEDGRTHKLKAKDPMILWAEFPNELPNFRIYLSRKAREDILTYYSQNRIAQAELQIEGFGKNKTRHFASTRLQTIAVLGG